MTATGVDDGISMKDDRKTSATWVRLMKRLMVEELKLAGRGSCGRRALSHSTHW
jgi:hypothetical protein